MKIAVLSAFAVGALVSTAPLEVNRLTLNKVAFANLINSSLYLSTFDGNPLGGKDYTYVIPDASGLASGIKDTVPIRIGGNVVWPNFVQDTPISLFGVPGVIISGGFLVPGRTSGGLWFSSLVNGKPGDQVELYRGRDYFYHQVEFYDVNQDGKMDILTCRANKPLVGAGKGDLTWLEPVDRTKPLGKWKETVIGKGCDTFFQVVDVDGDGYKDILSSEFWGSAVTLIQGNKGRFDVPANNKVITIDKTIGPAFEMQYVDVNGDGIKDLLVTNHVGDGAKAGVFAYEVPKVMTDKWVRHDLAMGFPVLQSGVGQASPGGAHIFFPDTNKATGKPHIIVAGDGSQKAYVLLPNSPDANDWTFTTSVVHDCQCTVGGIAVGDVNKDGKSELYIPCYDNNYLVTYSF
jgi:hypothetical protein